MFVSIAPASRICDDLFIFAIRIREAAMAIQKIDTKPRKLPRQARSKATVDAIIAASAQVLVAHGYEGATTARVAERAGVSIGSLYQYFPNKEALIAALIERHAGEIVSTMQRALDECANGTLQDGIRAIIQAGADAHCIHPALHKILTEQVPRVGKLATAMNTARQIAKMIERFLRAHADELNPARDPALAAIVIETAIESLVHKAVIERRELLADGQIEREVLALIAGYIERPERSPRRHVNPARS